LSHVLSFDEARARLLASVTTLPRERVGLDEATGRVVAENVVAPCDAPAFDYSAMDGYAVRAVEWPGSGAARLPLRGESRAGSSRSSLERGAACRIFTGAPVPDGADAVVMQEHVERDGDAVVFKERPKAGAHIRRRGEDLVRGAVAIVAGTRLRPSHVGLAASCDRAWLEVARRPAVSILGTGDELRPPGSLGREGLIPESNAVALRAMAICAGADVRVLPFAPDDRPRMREAFDSALRGTDLLVTIGGVSVGDHDLVRPVLLELGARIDFWKVAIKPGKPLLVGQHGGVVILGLPGNPSSAMVTFALFGVPLLRAMQGDARAVPVPMRALASREIPHSPGRLEFVRVKVARDKDGLTASPLENQASGAATSMASADALACVEEARGAVLPGESLDILWLDELGA
jgi:molybdopterin molybdotransferase